MSRVQAFRTVRRKVLAVHVGGLLFLIVVGVFFLVFTLPVNPVPLGEWAVVATIMATAGIPIAVFSPRVGVLKPIIERLDRGEQLSDVECVRFHRFLATHPLHASLVGLSGTVGVYTVGAAWMRLQHVTGWDSVAVMLMCGVLSGVMWSTCVYFLSEYTLRPLSGLVPSPAQVRIVPLSAKIFVSAATLVTAALGLFGLMGFTRAARIVEVEVGHRVYKNATELADLLAHFATKDSMPPPSWAETAATARVSANGHYLVIDSEGRILAAFPPGSESAPNLRDAALQPGIADQVIRQREGQLVDRYGWAKMIAFVPILDHPWKLVAVAPRSDFNDYLMQFIYSGLIAMGFSLLLAVGIVWLTTRSVTTALGEVIRAAQSVAMRRDLGQRVSFTTNDEVGQLGQAFNEMAHTLQEYAEQLEQLVAERTAELKQRGLELESKNRELEQRTHELEAMSREMRDFLHFVSHDLRAPLINIQGFAAVLKDSLRELQQETQGVSLPRWTKLRDEVNESIEFILRGVSKMDLLVKGLLELARIEAKPASRERIDTEKMLADIVGALQHQIRERQIQIEVASLPPITGDPIRLNQVFTNLIDNAIKYMRPDGEKRIEVGCTELEGAYRFYVRDTGTGISAEDQAKVFRLFTRVGSHDGVQGDGIGLAAVKKIVERHGGRIGVESEPGKGSTFWFTVPAGG